MAPIFKKKKRKDEEKNQSDFTLDDTSQQSIEPDQSPLTEGPVNFPGQTQTGEGQVEQAATTDAFGNPTRPGVQATTSQGSQVNVVKGGLIQDEEGNSFLGANEREAQNITNQTQGRSGSEAFGAEIGTKFSTAQQAEQAIRNNPEQFGLNAKIVETPEGFEIVQPQEGNFFELLGKSAKTPLVDFGLPSNKGVLNLMSDKTAGIVTTSVAALGVAAIGWSLVPAAAAGTTATTGQVFTTSQAAVQAGNAAKNAGIIKGALSKLGQFASKNPGAALVSAYGIFSLTENVFGTLSGEKVIEEQQAAINTLGAMATTIGGQATEATGDWRKGLQELNYLKQQIEFLEGELQKNKIKSAAIRVNGKVFDIEADMADQLATIDEQISIVQSFVVQGQFPELSEFEAQQILRNLEAEGILEPVDLTKSRRTFN